MFDLDGSLGPVESWRDEVVCQTDGECSCADCQYDAPASQDELDVLVDVERQSGFARGKRLLGLPLRPVDLLEAQKKDSRTTIRSPSRSSRSLTLPAKSFL